jgi:hypothetical protein
LTCEEEPPQYALSAAKAMSSATVSDSPPDSALAFMYDRHDAILKYDPMGHPALVAMDNELATNK